MDIYQPDRRRKGRARERSAARQRKQMVVRQTTKPQDADTVPIERPVMSRAPYEPGTFDTEVFKGRAVVMLRDGWWYVSQNRLIMVGIALLPVLLVALYLGSFILGNRVFPNVWVLGRDIGGMNADEASSMLQTLWTQETRITLADGSRIWNVTPAQIGVVLDAAATVEAARAIGLSGVPFGYGITPVVSLDFLAAQNTLLDLTEQTKILPYNAAFQWNGSQVLGVEGSDGRFLDIAATMAALEANLALTAESRRFDLIMTIVPPDVRDPSPYLAQAQAFVSHPFTIKGFDPFTNESFAWSTDRATLTSWLEVDTDGLTVREAVYANFVDAQTQSLQSTSALRYIETNDSIAKMREAIAENAEEFTVRVRYRSYQHEVEPGDTGYRIARRNGVPFYQLELANPNRDWEVPLVVGELVNIPSPDIMLPIDPVPSKRIVVNLRTQSLAVFENGEMIRTWVIASGMDRAPTSPGIFQILNHDEKASGGSYELCSDMGCAQWEMDWFMGIYEVVPGLVNGFHGNVLLPNGRLLGDGNVGSPATFGCVMSENEPAQWLFDWADEGTVVEIIAGDFLPRSAQAEAFWNDGARTQATPMVSPDRI
ncbi:MAG: peptidoglycan binding domain-containing protein [Anaerolineae bacterium]|nr:peptidoglycan binding domain-containing protein [Anaerolineae bacterium]NUQ03753.1 L,D-transpeptidase family protein [Anaerolineae bacterium]